nr:protein p7 [Hepacivirus rhabdomysis]
PPLLYASLSICNTTWEAIPRFLMGFRFGKVAAFLLCPNVVTFLLLLPINPVEA